MKLLNKAIIILFSFSLFFFIFLNFTENILASEILNYNEYLHNDDFYSKSEELENFKDNGSAALEIELGADELSDSSPDVSIVENFEGKKDAIKTAEQSFIEWEFEVEKTGFYNIEIEYFPLEGRRTDIQREILINGEYPFEGAQYLSFTRVWENESDIMKDLNGNEIRPRQVESPVWQKTYLQDSLGYFLEPYLFFLKEGKNTIRLNSVSEPMMVSSLKLSHRKIEEYEQLSSEYKVEDFKVIEDFNLKIQGQDARYKSHINLYPIHDASDPLVEPYHPSLIRLNTIGGYNWQEAGQWIEWGFEVPESGLYQIAFKVKQEENYGLASHRRMYINGKVPFEEVNNIPFPYSDEYYYKNLGSEENDSGYLFYLNEGRNTLRLEVVLGELGEIASQIESSLYELTTLYRNIVMITSRNPDHYRDYQLEERIPDLKIRLSVQIAIFEDLIEELESFSGEEGGATGFLQETLYLLNRMNDNTHHIPRLLNRYTDQLASLGEWMTDLMKQPLTVDNILIHSGNQDSAEVSPNLFQSFSHEMKKFSSTFTQDFSRVGDIHEQKNDNDEDITVWIGLGRDQGQVLKQMIEDSFSPETGIKVKLEIIENMGSLLVPASIAGTAPDVAIGAANMELAFRDALVNLKEFEDFKEVSERFKDSAFLPFTFRDRVYGLPETQGFPMMFYRKDILEELDIDVPQTWDDIYEILPLLQRNNMSIGLGNLVSPADTEPNINTLLLFLYQNRIALYKEDGIATNLDSEASIQVTKQLADLYNLYNLPYQFNTQTRFRYGEVPIVITTYGLYNSLQVFAPELRGEWGFAPVPGIREEDGTINRAVPVGGAQLMMPGGLSGGAGVHATVPPGTTGTVIMENSDNKELAWEFLKWWTRSDTQFRFGLELEGLMGSAARYATANIKAMEQLPWQIHEREALMEQWDWVEGIPPVLGSYYVSRQVDWLIRALILNKEPLRESVQYYNRSANVEIRRKRSEFNLVTDINKLDERWKELYWQHYTVVDRLNFDEYQEIRYLIEMPENIFE